MSRLVVHKHAVKYIQKLPSNKKAQVKKLLKKLAEAPADYPGTISMVGKWSGYKRIRIGSLRVIYWFDPSENIIYVDHVGPRGDIYKKVLE